MTHLDVVVLGHPRPQPRPRVFRGGRVQTDSPGSLEWKVTIVEALLAATWDRVADGVPLHLDLELALPVLDKRRHGLWATTRPDVDNLSQTILDALQAPEAKALKSAVARLPGGKAYAGVMCDDSQVVSLSIHKRWSPAPGGARIRLTTAS